MDLIPYGVGILRKTTLLDGGDSPAGLVFESAATLATGDFKIVNELTPIANLSAESIAFTSGSVKPLVGETLTGATSSATLVVIGYYLTSGSWAGGDAAGTLFVEQVSGTFQSENLNGATGGSNIMTIGGDVTGGAFVMVGTTVWYALTSTETACAQGMVQWQDQGATVFQSDAWEFATYGNTNAMFSSEAVADALETYGVAVAGDPMTLEDGAITSGKFASSAINAAALAADAVDEILDEQIGDSTITVRQALRIMVAALAGKASGLDTTEATFRNVADDQDVIVATVDADGNRTAVTLDP